MEMNNSLFHFSDDCKRAKERDFLTVHILTDHLTQYYNQAASNESLFHYEKFTPSC